VSERPHGYARYRLDGCRCNACGWARYQYDSRRSRLVAQGRWQPYVDPAEARGHAERLRAGGLGTRQIADLAGLNRKALQDVLNGRTRRIRPATHAAILAVPADAELADKTVIPAEGTWRRVQALAAAGWSLTAQAREVGWQVGNYCALLKRPHLTAHTARLVRDLYGRWSMLPPPTGPRADLARRRARERSWFPPMAWDDDALDRPDARPCLLPAVADSDPDVDDLRIQQFIAGFGVKLTWREKTEVAHRLRGRSLAETGEVLGCQPKTVGALRSEHWSRRAEAC